jgi:hypothetical protein
MRKTSLPLPVIALIGATRGMLGAGSALLIADRMDPERPNEIGRILFAIGALSTIPLAPPFLRSRRASLRRIPMAGRAQRRVTRHSAEPRLSRIRIVPSTSKEPR